MDFRAISAQGPALSQVNADALVVVLTPDLGRTGDDALDRLVDDALKAQDFALKAGKTPEEAISLCKLFKGMITGEETDEEKLGELEDATILKDISHLPAREKCAELAWRTLEEMLEERTKDQD